MAEETGKADEPGDPRVYFAAERTLLAWVRTGLALMGFGFVVARFGLFLREIADVHQRMPPRRLGLSLWIGTSLVLLGVAVNVLAAIRHWRTIERLERGLELRFGRLSLAILLAFALAVLGGLMAAYLVLVE